MFPTMPVGPKTPTAASIRRVKKPEKRPVVRIATVSDYEAIATVQKRNGLVPRSATEWAAFWSGNPACMALGGEWPIGWVLEDEAGGMVGTISNLPMQCRFQGRDVLAACAFAWAVDVSYRRYSLILLNHFMKQGGVDLLLSTTVSPTSEPAFRGFGWSKVPVESCGECSFWITNYDGFARSTLAKRNMSRYALLRAPLAAALFLRDMVLCAGFGGKPLDPEIEFSSAFDRRFDVFWKRLERQRGNVLLAVRTFETLAWHYRRAQGNSPVIVACSRKGRLRAFAVFERQDNPGFGLKRVRLLDFQALRGEESLIGPAISAMLDRCRKEEVHVLEVPYGLPVPAKPRSVYRRKLDFFPCYYRPIDERLCEPLARPESWAPSAFEGDASL